jgi:hypothetical protein
MGFMSSLKRVTAAVATGGLSLTQSTKRQEQIGTAIGVGTAIVAGGAAASSLFGTAPPEVAGVPPAGASSGRCAQDQSTESDRAARYWWRTDRWRSDDDRNTRWRSPGCRV